MSSDPTLVTDVGYGSLSLGRRFESLSSSMSVVLKYDALVSHRERSDSQELLLEIRLNLLALEYGYRYRLDIGPGNGPARVEFVRTIREARCVASPERRAGRSVLFFKIQEQGTLTRHNW